MRNLERKKTRDFRLKEGGYIALVSVLIITTLVLLIASSASLLGISESDMGLQENQAWEAFYLATACVEDALMKLKDNLEYTGGETLTFDNGTCAIELVEGIGNENRIIKVSGTAYNQVRKIKVEINQVNPDTLIKFWQQVAEF